MGSFVCLSCLLSSYDHENVKSDSSFVVSADDSKVSVTVWAKYLRALERSYLVLPENAIDCWTLMVISKMSTPENAAFFIFTLNITQTKIQKYNIFWKNSGRSFIFTCPNCDYFLLLSAVAIWKISHFLHFNDNNFGSKHDNETNGPIFLISYLSFIRCYIYFMHFKTLKIQFHGVPLLHCVLVCKIHLSCRRLHF